MDEILALSEYSVPTSLYDELAEVVHRILGGTSPGTSAGG
jgi:hypothetical protein